VCPIAQEFRLPGKERKRETRREKPLISRKMRISNSSHYKGKRIPESSANRK